MRMKQSAAVISFVCMLLGWSSAVKAEYDPQYCAAKYPVVLVHGVGFRDTTLVRHYWGSTPDALQSYGAKVFSGGQDAYGIIAGNAEILKNQILIILRDTGAKKVNIIAHSRGGLESRYMISKLGMRDKVASLTTISTPHRGSAMADVIMKEISDENILPSAIDFFAKIIGDTNPESFNAGKELTRSYMKSFNADVADVPGVYYQSYAGEINGEIINQLWKQMYLIMHKYEGPNDGLVSVESAKWGVFRGVMSCNGKARVAHADEIGQHFRTGMFCFDADDFYIKVVHELKVMGY